MNIEEILSQLKSEDSTFPRKAFFRGYQTARRNNPSFIKDYRGC
ncbi:hypothetical protein [Crocosphaera watsonii]|uniref:Uncharacterized protein n=2 Tax=Crocosphaera watsonii TaxID=263511 RepID=G5J993_CROWT|nr:hypothetical protein [Crocosphaera watsonii]EHJ11245.1 hypothetical protein CWATWH0003_4010 [Crocosphaera watsonii WH 0003]CCQ53883.1 hypothetical protein CWATWH0005_4181 [Crocosphaera watsonii WH 0005]